MRLSFTVLTLFSLCGLCSCGPSSGSRRIAVIPRLGADAQWLTLHVGVSEEADQRGVKVYWRGPTSDQTVQEQIDLASEAVSNSAYGIVVRPASHAAETRVLDQAIAHGIPVVVLAEHIALPPSPHLYFVLTDTRRTGQLIAERLQQTVQEGDVAILGLDPEMPGNMERVDSMETSLRQSAPQIHVIDKMARVSSGSYLDQSVRQMILSHPQLRAIVALNAGEGLSAAAASLAAGTRDRVKIIVVDQSIDVLLLLRSGIIDSVVVQPIREMGKRAIDRIVSDHEQESVPHETIYQPTLVTRENIDSEAIQAMLAMHRSPPW